MTQGCQAAALYGSRKSKPNAQPETAPRSGGESAELAGYMDYSTGADMADKKEIKAARSIAEHIFALGGPDLRGLPDDELAARIKAGTKQMADAVRSMGVSAEHAAEAFQRIGAALAKVDGKDI